MNNADPNLNALWCRCIGEELVRAGVREVVLCPGNRNVPLGFALARIPGLRLIPHVDERSAAFLALGLARMAGRPVAVCTTSGSAVANCLPALCEAHHAHLPLLLLSADRPVRLHGCEAPQTMQQAGIFHEFVHAELALREPAADKPHLIELRREVHAWAARCAGAGPGHCNIPLDDPLPPLPDPDFVAPRDAGLLPQPASPAQTTAINPTLPEFDPTGLWSGMRGLIVAGPACPLEPAVVARLARRTRFPVVADAASGLRAAGIPGLVTTADALLTGALGEAGADVLIRLGPAPVARPVWEYCRRHSGPVLRIDRHRVDHDFCHADFQLLVRPGAHELDQLCTALGDGDAAWRERWVTAEARALAGRERHLAGLDWGEPVAAAAVCAATGYAFVQFANSMAVRHANLHLRAPTCPPRVIAQRGVNGIDGTLGSFIGGLLAADGPGLLLCGDLAFLHDLPALAAVERDHLHGTICVIDNGGGAIFDLLPVADLPDYQRLVRTPSPVDRAAIARGFGLTHRRCENAATLTAALQAAREEPGLSVVEAVVPPESLARDLPGLIATMAG